MGQGYAVPLRNEEEDVHLTACDSVPELGQARDRGGLERPSPYWNLREDHAHFATCVRY